MCSSSVSAFLGRRDRLLVIAIVVATVAGIYGKESVYVITYFPLLTLGAVVGYSRFLSWRTTIALVLLASLSELVIVAHDRYQSRGTSLAEVTNEVRRTIPAGQSVFLAPCG